MSWVVLDVYPEGGAYLRQECATKEEAQRVADKMNGLASLPWTCRVFDKEAVKLRRLTLIDPSPRRA